MSANLSECVRSNIGLADSFDAIFPASSSYIWIKYMALHLQMTDMDKAREVCDRALKTINFREEGERFNVFVARLNLENMYGTREQVMAQFEEACKLSDPKKMHMSLLGIFEKGDDSQVTEQFFKTCTRKYRQSCKVWLRYCQFKLKGGHAEAAQRVLDRALEAVPKRKHVKLISRFALIEYKQGSAERGRTLMEGVVSSYPKRIDLWSVYIDMELKHNGADAARQLFERVVTVKLRARQAKFFFKRWLELEKEHGSKQTTAAVKDKARAWVEEHAT